MNKYYFGVGANLRKKNVYEDLDKRDFTLAINEGSSTDSSLVYEEKRNLIDITKTEFNTTWEFQPYINFIAPALEKGSRFTRFRLYCILQAGKFTYLRAEI
jgi:hypothetical protein